MLIHGHVIIALMGAICVCAQTSTSFAPHNVTQGVTHIVARQGGGSNLTNDYTPSRTDPASPKSSFIKPTSSYISKTSKHYSSSHSIPSSSSDTSPKSDSTSVSQTSAPTTTQPPVTTSNVVPTTTSAQTTYSPDTPTPTSSSSSTPTTSSSSTPTTSSSSTPTPTPSSSSSATYTASKTLSSNQIPSSSLLSSVPASSSVVTSSDASISSSATATPSFDPSNNLASTSSSTNTGAIAGGVVGGVAGLAIIGGLLLAWKVRRRKQAEKDIPYYADDMVDSDFVDHDKATPATQATTMRNFVPPAMMEEEPHSPQGYYDQGYANDHAYAGQYMPQGTGLYEDYNYGSNTETSSTTQPHSDYMANLMAQRARANPDHSHTDNDFGGEREQVPYSPISNESHKPDTQDDMRYAKPDSSE